MKDLRKTIKVTIPSSHVFRFDECKHKAEQSAMIKLSDTQYASRLVIHALDSGDKLQKAKSLIVKMTNLAEFGDIPSHHAIWEEVYEVLQVL